MPATISERIKTVSLKSASGDAFLPMPLTFQLNRQLYLELPHTCHFDRPTGAEKPLEAVRDANVCGALCIKKPLEAVRDANVCGALCIKKPLHFADASITKEAKWDSQAYPGSFPMESK
jgi:hypothetical protein